MHEPQPAMTAAEMIERLSSLPPKTPIMLRERSTETGKEYLYAIFDINDRGEVVLGDWSLARTK